MPAINGFPDGPVTIRRDTDIGEHLDQISDFVAEQLAYLVHCDARIFNGIVQERCRQSCLGVRDCLYDARNFDWMDDVGSPVYFRTGPTASCAALAKAKAR